MIQFEKALNLIDNIVQLTKKKELVSIENALDRVVAKNYKAKYDSPKFDCSSMDGIVINEIDLRKYKKFKIVGECRAGQIKSDEIQNGEAKFIYTGGPIPGKKKKLIIIKERCEFIKDNFVKVNSYLISDYIRKKGSDFKKNDICIKKHSILNIRSLSLASFLEIKHIDVLVKPKVAILITGDEIKSTKNPKGIINSSNTIMLKGIIKMFGGTVVDLKSSKDSTQEIISGIEDMSEFDILITSGGISEGKYDLVKDALLKKGLKIEINKIAMKPGKPIIFGKFFKNKYYLGLPGNPVSCYIGAIFFLKRIMTCFFGLQKKDFEGEISVNSQLIPKNNQLTSIQRINLFINKKKSYFKLCKKQDSSLLRTLSESHGIIIRKPFSKEILPGEKVLIYRFDKIINKEI